jgi:excisionase family DNA binding protein
LSQISKKNSDPTATLFSRREAAAYLRLSETSIWRLMKSGQLPCARVGGRLLFRRTDCDALVERSLQVA